MMLVRIIVTANGGFLREDWCTVGKATVQTVSLYVLRRVSSISELKKFQVAYESAKNALDIPAEIR